MAPSLTSRMRIAHSISRSQQSAVVPYSIFRAGFRQHHGTLTNRTSRMKPRIAIFFTGGTISMRVDPQTGGAIPALSGEEIIAQVPGLEALADFDVLNFGRLPGPHWTPQRMLELAQAVRAKLADDNIDGAVITHGTDTLEETAYCLDLLLNANKPVVFV